jgi:hypothetical protein
MGVLTDKINARRLKEKQERGREMISKEEIIEKLEQLKVEKEPTLESIEEESVEEPTPELVEKPVEEFENISKTIHDLEEKKSDDIAKAEFNKEEFIGYIIYLYTKDFQEKVNEVEKIYHLRSSDILNKTREALLNGKVKFDIKQLLELNK